jgi:3-dehydrosphinganine reductase
MLVNNAGISRVGELCDAKPEDYRETMAVNYFGTVWTTLAFLPHFQQQRSGVVCGVSSLLGLMGLYGYSAYAGSKFALTGFFDCLRQDLLKYGVQVSVLFPADTDTPQLHEENKMKPAATKAIAGNAGIASPEFVANAFLDGVLAGKYQIIPGLESKFVVWANNKIPQVMRWYITRDLRRHWQRASEPGAAPAV